MRETEEQKRQQSERDRGARKSRADGDRGVRVISERQKKVRETETQERQRSKRER